jgi:hypothetical protein
MNARNLVILRGSYRPKGGGQATHYLLGTLYTKGPTEIVADDPWTGKQVYIDPATKTVISPKNFPLDKFKVDGYQPVTIN